MPHQPNWQEFGNAVGQDKPIKDATNKYDATYGMYDEKLALSGKPTQAVAKLPAEHSPFSVKGK